MSLWREITNILYLGLGAINLAGLVLGILAVITETNDERYEGARLIYRS